MFIRSNLKVIYVIIYHTYSLYSCTLKFPTDAQKYSIYTKFKSIKMNRHDGAILFKNQRLQISFLILIELTELTSGSEEKETKNACLSGVGCSVS